MNVEVKGSMPWLDLTALSWGDWTLYVGVGLGRGKVVNLLLILVGIVHVAGPRCGCMSPSSSNVYQCGTAFKGCVAPMAASQLPRAAVGNQLLSRPVLCLLLAQSFPGLERVTDCLKTAWRLLEDRLKTAWRLLEEAFDDPLMIPWWPLDDPLMTPWWLLKDLTQNDEDWVL